MDVPSSLQSVWSVRPSLFNRKKEKRFHRLERTAKSDRDCSKDPIGKRAQLACDKQGLSLTLVLQTTPVPLHQSLRFSKIPLNMPPPPVTREALLTLYKQLLRSAQTYPSKKRAGIYQAIREEWRDHKDQQDEEKVNMQISMAYKGLSQLRQFGKSVRGHLQSISFGTWVVSVVTHPYLDSIFAHFANSRYRNHDERKDSLV